jgi:hypothetical protein
MTKLRDLTGQRFGRLIVLERGENLSRPPCKSHPNGKSRITWVCQCDCGTIKTISAEKLYHKKSPTRSCGCLNTDTNRAKAYLMHKANTKYHPSIGTARGIWAKIYKDGPDGLSFEEFYDLSQKPCHYCGSKPNNSQNSPMSDKLASAFAKENGTFVYNGLDRIDSTKHHTLDNVVPCCKWCNYAKRERTTEEFKAWAKRLHDNLFIQKETDSNCLESVSELALVS